MAFGSLALSAASGRLVWQSPRLDRALGGAGRSARPGAGVAPATADYQPTDPQIAFYLARFIEQVRSIPADAIIVRQNWLRAYDFTTQAARWRSTTMPARTTLRQGRQEQVAVEVSASSAPRRRASASPGSSAAIRTGARRTERWSAILTVAVQPPRDADTLRKNPLGIYVNAINWSKELGQ
jgi:type IV secretion system protein VirB5